MTTSLLNNPPMKQNTNKPLGHPSPSMMAHDLAEINRLLSKLGAPIRNNTATQLGDIHQRVLWLLLSCEVRVLEQVKDEDK